MRSMLLAIGLAFVAGAPSAQTTAAAPPPAVAAKTATPPATVTPPAAAASGTGRARQTEKMRACNAEAKAKALKGDERKAFMKGCLSNKAAG
jgi:psiF repeat